MPEARRNRRSFGKTPLTPLLKPQNHFSQICKLSKLPKVGTHGENFFFQMGYQVDTWICEGVSAKKSGVFAVLPARQRNVCKISVNLRDSTRFCQLRLGFGRGHPPQIAQANPIT